MTQPPSHNQQGRSWTRRIQDAVCARYGIAREDLLSSSRKRQVAWPRQLGIYLTHRVVGRSTNEIGAAFGGRDHSTVLHAIASVKERLRLDAETERDAGVILRALDTGMAVPPRAAQAAKEEKRARPAPESRRFVDRAAFADALADNLSVPDAAARLGIAEVTGWKLLAAMRADLGWQAC